MPGDIRKLNIIVLVVLATCVAIVLAVPAPVEANRLYYKGNSQHYLTTDGFDGVGPAVVEDAARRAESLYGRGSKAAEDFTDQLIGAFKNCEDIDILLVFNAGGFGWDSVTDASGWLTVMDGIMGELSGRGYKLLAVDYKRSQTSLTGVLSEAMAFWGFYPFKSAELAERIDFLTLHLEGLQVIITGESNGASIVEETFRRLEDNQRVFAIQTGPTVITRCVANERSLVLRHNGSVPDSFSQGDVFTIIRSNLEAMLGIYQEQPGDILFYIGAPGHYYCWDYVDLRQAITEFLQQHF